MSQNQESKTLLAVGLLTVAAAIGINLLVDADSLFDGAPLLFLALLVAGLGLVAWTWVQENQLSRSTESEASGDAALALPQAREWVLPEITAESAAPAPTPAAPLESAEAEASAEAAASAEADDEADDLTRIEGIGPVFSKRLIESGVTTFAQLAAKSEDEIRTLLTEAGSRLIPPSVSTWAEQAALAAQGDWDSLAALQAALSGGRRSDDS